MSWNKNTLVFSEIDSTLQVLKELDVPHKLEILGKVIGNGLNDDTDDGSLKEYEIRKLTYANYVIYEQMVRNEDCDCDDVIYSFKFDKDKEPFEWEIERTADEL